LPRSMSVLAFVSKGVSWRPALAWLRMSGFSAPDV
jgi:hypothetical protein